MKDAGLHNWLTLRSQGSIPQQVDLNVNNNVELLPPGWSTFTSEERSKWLDQALLANTSDSELTDTLDENSDDMLLLELT